MPAPLKPKNSPHEDPRFFRGPGNILDAIQSLSIQAGHTESALLQIRRFSIEDVDLRTIEPVTRKPKRKLLAEEKEEEEQSIHTQLWHELVDVQQSVEGLLTTLQADVRGIYARERNLLLLALVSLIRVHTASSRTNVDKETSPKPKLKKAKLPDRRAIESLWHPLVVDRLLYFDDSEVLNLIRPFNATSARAYAVQALATTYRRAFDRKRFSGKTTANPDRDLLFEVAFNYCVAMDIAFGGGFRKQSFGDVLNILTKRLSKKQFAACAARIVWLAKDHLEPNALKWLVAADLEESAKGARRVNYRATEMSVFQGAFSRAFDAYGMPY